MTATAKKTDLVQRAASSWGEPPDWVLELAEQAMATSQGRVAKRIGYSGSVVSQVISNSYAGDLERVETAVRGALMHEVVGCPILGVMARNRCLDWQAKPFSNANSLNPKMHRACRSGCPHSRLTTEF